MLLRIRYESGANSHSVDATAGTPLNPRWDAELERTATEYSVRNSTGMQLLTNDILDIMKGCDWLEDMIFKEGK